MDSERAERREPLTPYQRRLFLFLSVATFFEGYDFFALTQLLPNLQQAMRLSDEALGFMVAFINAGTVVAYLLVRRADRWGRRRVLTITIAGYTLLTLLTAFSPNAYFFALFQMLARIFLVGEYAVSMVIAAEEFPAARRGMVIGVIQAFTTFGAIACAGLVPSLLSVELLPPDQRWRLVYAVGVIPLLLLAYARRNLKETQRFVEQGSEDRAQPFTYIFKTAYRKRLLQLAAIWFLTYICTQNAVTFWKQFALVERGMTDAEIGKAITIAAVGALPLVFLSGKFIDLVGRRLGALVIFGLSAIGVFGSYTFYDYWLLTFMLMWGIFGTSAVLPVLNAYTAELFPTNLRGAAYAWGNNLIGRVGYVLSPFGVGLLAGQLGWGASVRATALALILALVLILVLLPETKSKELEQTAAL